MNPNGCGWPGGNELIQMHSGGAGFAGSCQFAVCSWQSRFSSLRSLHCVEFIPLKGELKRAPLEGGLKRVPQRGVYAPLRGAYLADLCGKQEARCAACLS